MIGKQVNTQVVTFQQRVDMNGGKCTDVYKRQIQDNFANIHEITQEFIRLQMQKDQEYQTYYEKTLHIFSELIDVYKRQVLFIFCFRESL